jgi:hypothetical protein
MAKSAAQYDVSAEDAASGPAVPPQGRIVEAAKFEEGGGDEMHDARQGGEIETVKFEEDETRPQELHGAADYQKETADPGKEPSLVRYTELTKARE